MMVSPVSSAFIRSPFAFIHPLYESFARIQALNEGSAFIRSNSKRLCLHMHHYKKALLAYALLYEGFFSALILDHIPHAAHRMDQINPEGIIDLLPEVADVHVDHVGLPEIRKAPHFLDQAVARKDDVLVLQECS